MGQNVYQCYLFISFSDRRSTLSLSERRQTLNQTSARSSTAPLHLEIPSVTAFSNPDPELWSVCPENFRRTGILAFLSIPGFDMVVISSMVTLSESDNETDVASRHIIECDEVNSSQIMTSSLCSRFSMDRNDIPQHASSNIFQIIPNNVCNCSFHMITNPELLNRKRGAPGSEGMAKTSCSILHFC
ncbi:hypothetical protein ZOSMA_213G00100 [Zostera marina]|uniref:Uncharacterized protein n=1 Tax=Zostera marina TaxID=29655 RepID=A0A0K9PKI3_ZOSMR|nr:hypothetical protein ZOSMA_213G00100 [Zostera marina]